MKRLHYSSSGFGAVGQIAFDDILKIVTFRSRFMDFTGRFVHHCHIMSGCGTSPERWTHFAGNRDRLEFMGRLVRWI
jgi:hypothetical protein